MIPFNPVCHNLGAFFPLLRHRLGLLLIRAVVGVRVVTMWCISSWQRHTTHRYKITRRLCFYSSSSSSPSPHSPLSSLDTLNFILYQIYFPDISLTAKHHHHATLVLRPTLNLFVMQNNNNIESTSGLRWQSDDLLEVIRCRWWKEMWWFGESEWRVEDMLWGRRKVINIDILVIRLSPITTHNIYIFTYTRIHQSQPVRGGILQILLRLED